MSNTEDISHLERPPSQFSLAAIFYIVTLMSLVFSATAPFFRAINAENRAAILSYGLLQISVVCGCLGTYLFRRFRIIRMLQNGELIHRTSFLDPGSLGVWRSIRALWTTIPVLLTLFTAGLLITANPLNVFLFLHPVAWPIQILAVRDAVRSTLSLYYGVDRRDVEIFKRGYVYGGYRFQPWETTKYMRPAVHDESAIMIVSSAFAPNSEFAHANTMSTSKIIVRPDRRTEILDVVKEQIGIGS